MTEWQGRTAVLTGGGRGFGLAFGHALSSRGAHVVLIDLDREAGEAGAASIREAGGIALALTGDVTDPKRMTEAMAEASQTNGGIDLLINNAGLHSQAYSRPILEMGAEKVRHLFDVNVMGTLTCTLAAHPHLSGRAGANILNIASKRKKETRLPFWLRPAKKIPPPPPSRPAGAPQKASQEAYRTGTWADQADDNGELESEMFAGDDEDDATFAHYREERKKPYFNHFPKIPKKKHNVNQSQGHDIYDNPINWP